MRRRAALGAAALLLALALSVPASMAAESVVGVVYQSWTLQECKDAFGNRPYITNNPDILGVEEEYKQYKGPLYSNEQETGCWCGEGKILSEDKSRCIDCEAYEARGNAVYYTDEKAAEGAEIMVKGKDIGCRCVEKEGQTVSVQNNVCEYVDVSGQTDACRARFGQSGVEVCAEGAASALKLGTAEFKGSTVDCCCKSGYEIRDTEDLDEYPGGKMCEQTKATPNDEKCAEIAKASGHGEGAVECPEYLRTSDYSSLDDGQKEEWDRRRLGNFPTLEGRDLYCCCGSGHILDDSGRCVPVRGECDEIVPGSVKGGRPDASDIEVGKDYGGKKWDEALVRKLEREELTCYCGEDTVPAGPEDNPDVLTKCVAVESAKDCAKLVPGSIPTVPGEKRGEDIVAGERWDPELISKLEELEIECSCPEGYEGYDFDDSGNGKDVCGIGEIRCMDGEDLAAMVKVGICRSKTAGSTEFDFSEQGAIAFAGPQDVVVKTKDRHVLVRAAEGLAHGFTHMTGLRSLYHWVGRAYLGCSSENDGTLKGVLGQLRCTADFPCDQMPELVEGGGESGALRLARTVGGGVAIHMGAASGVRGYLAFWRSLSGADIFRAAKLAGRVAVVYAVADGLIAATTSAISDDISVEPGDYTVGKASIDKIITIKSSEDKDKVYAFDSIKFSASGGDPGTSILRSGGLLDLSTTATVAIAASGNTLKCNCDPSCSPSKELGDGDGCVCYPVEEGVVLKASEQELPQKVVI